jgi:two-component system, NtrC family, sensor kinase
MSRRQLTHAFDPLYTTQKSAGGCGLGLSIAREIIQRHQGFIKVSSREGGGTVVTVDLPITVHLRSFGYEFSKGDNPVFTR